MTELNKMHILRENTVQHFLNLTYGLALRNFYSTHSKFHDV